MGGPVGTRLLLGCCAGHHLRTQQRPGAGSHCGCAPLRAGCRLRPAAPAACGGGAATATHRCAGIPGGTQRRPAGPSADAALPGAPQLHRWVNGRLGCCVSEGCGRACPVGCCSCKAPGLGCNHWRHPLLLAVNFLACLIVLWAPLPEHPCVSTSCGTGDTENHPLLNCALQGRTVQSCMCMVGLRWCEPS